MMSMFSCTGTRTSRATKGAVAFCFSILAALPGPTAARRQALPGLKSGTEKSLGSSCRFTDGHRDSLLIKSAAMAFLSEDGFGSRSNFRARKAMAAFLDCRRADLANPNHVQPDQHCRAARRVSHALRAYLGAGA